LTVEEVARVVGEVDATAVNETVTFVMLLPTVVVRTRVSLLSPALKLSAFALRTMVQMSAPSARVVAVPPQVTVYHAGLAVGVAVYGVELAAVTTKDAVGITAGSELRT
jgi:hypothetical protein